MVQRHEQEGSILRVLMSSWSGKVLATSHDIRTHRGLSGLLDRLNSIQGYSTEDSGGSEGTEPELEAV